MAVEVFNRYENKFLTDNTTYNRILDRLLDDMELDEYSKAHDFYTISNLYYDTKDNYLIRTSMSKPLYKEKLRLRAYGVPRLDSKVYLEIKKKFNGLTNKRRTSIRLDAAYDFVATGIKPEITEHMNRQVVNEIEYILRLYRPEPKLYLAYDRKALFGRREQDLRITFDTNIRTRRDDLRLESGDRGEALLEPGQWLMEVKVGKSIPFWLSQLLSDYGIYSIGFSKYGREYSQYLLSCKNQKGVNNPCLNHFSAQPRLIPQYL